jgi:drug/metabolite transporter (DMT)-like permease
MSNHAANYRGILAMVGGCAFFSANDAATKIAAQYLPVSQVVFTRAVFALAFAFLIILWRREVLAVRHVRNPYLLLRAFIEAFTGLLVIYSLTHMPIANMTAILLIQPFLMTAIGVLFLREQAGWRRWVAIFAGFAGMLLVMKPGTEGFNWVSLLVLFSACIAIARDLLVRKIGNDVPTTVISFSTALLAVPIGLMGSMVEDWQMPSTVPLVAIAISAFFLVIAFIFMVIAFRGTDVSVVSPFRYSIVIFAVFFGLTVFGEMPDALSILGIAIIVAAGLYMLHREQVRRKSATEAKT